MRSESLMEKTRRKLFVIWDSADLARRLGQPKSPVEVTAAANEVLRDAFNAAVKAVKDKDKSEK